MGLRGVQGGLRGEIEIFPGPPAKKVINELSSLLFISTPQSIAKPSPGWNKVALLTAVRNSPCSCPFSVSLHPPLAALNSEPRPGSLFIANQKLSPRAGKVARSAERGAAKNSRMPRVIPPSASLTLSRTLVRIWSSCSAAACNTPYSARFSPRCIAHWARSARIPRFTVEPLGAVQTRRTVPYPFAERSFQWGYGGCRGA